MRLDQVEVDDVLARLAEQRVDVHVRGPPGGPVEVQVLPVPDPRHQLEPQ